MSKIKQLSVDVVEKIAAGEVVERPASVVKELIENAIDASARSITVDIEEGGCKRITVIDDGCGMDPEDLKNAVLRHATSKISSADDLWRITTMGFRGEALASIAAVSRLAIESKLNCADVIEGARLEMSGGTESGLVVAGCAGGTKTEVRDLFFNVPARRKFLRSAAVEVGHIYDAIVALALAYPKIRFELTVDGCRRLSLLSGEAHERARAVLGDRTSREFICVEESGPLVSIKGLVAEGGRKGGKDVYFFINHRPIKDRMLMHALTQAYGERSADGQYPAAVLWMGIDPSRVDVNVHPTKREVRFSESGAVHSFVVSAIKKHLSEATVEVTTDAGVEDALLRFERNRLKGQSELGTGRARLAKPKDSPASNRFDVAQADDWPLSLNPLGQYGLSYIICEHSDGSLVLIDQHAAHERLGFDRMCADYRSGSIPQQRLLIPESVELGEKASAYIIENADVLTRAGFEIEPFGGGTVLVKAVPELLGNASVASLMEKLADEFEELGRSQSIDEAMERIFALVACHGQARAGDKLNSEELARLVRDVERQNINSCPHGRPAVVRIEKEQVDKWFKRS